MSETAVQLEQLEDMITAEPDRRGWFGKKRTVTEPDLVGFFKGMPENERRTLAPQFLRWRREAARYESPLDERNVWLGLFATATLSEIKDHSWWGVDERAIAILLDRNVPWFSEWVEQALEQRSSAFGIGGLVGDLVDLVDRGVIDPPEHDNYAIGVAYMSLERWGSAGRKDIPPVDQVRPVLNKIEHAIWRQFEVEGGGEVSLANFEKYLSPKVRGRWSDTLETLSNEGLLDRQRLLDASLDALNRGFKQFRAGWFSRFHEQLKPTHEERAARADRYLGLLASPIGPTVSMALAALKKIQKARLLDEKLLLANIEPALYAGSAKTAKDGLQLLAGVVSSDRDQLQAALTVAAAGLEHPKTDVQEASLAFMENHADAVCDDAQMAIAMRLDVMSPVLRDRAQVLLTGTDHATAVEQVPVQDLDELVTRAQALPDRLRDLAGVNFALDEIKQLHGRIAAAPFNGMDVPRLDPAGAIAPVGTFEELIDEALVAIEHPSELDRVERVLAGAVLFAADRPANEKELLGPLARALKRFNPQSYQGLDWYTPRGALQIVLCAMLGETSDPVFADDEDPRSVMLLRTDAMASAILKRRLCTQFSAPTHNGCWIDSGMLVERTRNASKETLGLADQCLALLRLVPDGRPQALKSAAGLSGEWASALRYALGGDEPIGETPSIWVAAARSRDPFGDNEDTIPVTGESRHGEHLAPALCYSIDWGKTRHGDDRCKLTIGSGAPGEPGIDFGKESWFWEREVERPKTPPRAKTCLPTVGLSDPRQLRLLDTYLYNEMTHLVGSWTTAIWPQHPEPIFALSAKAGCMLDGVVGFEPATEPIADGLIMILDPDVPVGPMGRLMLARGFNALDKGTAQATVDALIAVIEDGRLDGEMFGVAMHGLLMGGIIVAKRWADRLRDVARASPLAAQVIRRALEVAVYPGEPQRPMRNMHAWLEVLQELCVAAGEAIEDPEARNGLAQHFTSGKARKVANDLLKLEPSTATEHRKAAVGHALEQRIARAQRWAARGL
ncbi:MAG: hypothetical protein HKN11_07435 [Rhizobiales bacterium]|nr:hypothetical protein [Hyphomicrobiales bacterium]